MQEMYHIVLSATKSLYKQTMVVMMSAIINCKKSCHFYIMQDDWTSEEKTICEQFVALHPKNKIDFIHVDKNLFEGLIPWKGSHNNYYKIIAHCFLPDNIDRFIYLDCDTVILKDIEKYYSMDFNGSYFIVSTEELSLEGYTERTEKYMRLKWTPFNSGVILFNAKKLREENITIDFYNKAALELSGREYFADQGLLSYIFYGKVTILPSYKYNHLLFQEGSVKKPYSFKYIFSLSKEDRKKKICPPYWDEDYDESQDGTIVHFTGAVSKPWSCLVYKKNGELSFEIPILKHDLEKKDVVYFYIKWWEIAAQLPGEIYSQILMEAVSSGFADYVKDTKESLFWMTNAKNFFEQLSLDCFSGNRVKNFLTSLQNKKVGIIKANDAAGRFVIKNLENAKTQIIFKSGKAFLKELTADEWATCKTADIIICCCVHGTRPEARDGIKPIMIKDILNDASWSMDTPTEKAATELSKEYSLEIKSLETRIDSLIGQNSYLSSNLDTVSNNLICANEQAQVLRTECARLQQTVSTMENSRSWRLTKPLRAISRFFRKLSGKK